MGDKLEKFILENRSLFDGEEPGSEVWDRIYRHTGKKQGPRRVWWKIAAVFFLATSIYLVVERNFAGADSDSASVTFNAEFRRAEQFYINLISQKRQEINQQDQSRLTTEFLKEIDKLDRMYEELKQTYTHQGSGRLTDAMIRNLQLRIDILDQQLRILKHLREEKDENNAVFEM